MKLAGDQDCSLSETAKILEVSKTNLWRWRKQFGPFPQKGQLRQSEKEELNRLRIEVRQLRMEYAVLKKAAVLFAKDLL